MSGVPELTWLENNKDLYFKEGDRVLDVGSFDVNGSPREFLEKEASEYVGIDIEMGKGVDIKMNGHDLESKFGLETFDVIMCLNWSMMSLLCWVTLESMRRILKPNGFLVISTPFINFPLHDYPDDFYRFTESAYKKVFFRNYAVLKVEKIFTKPNEVNPLLAGIGQKI